MKIPSGHVLCQHLWRKDADGNPLVAALPEIAFNKAPSYMGPDPETGQGQVVIPHQGWKKIDPKSIVTPKAAEEAAKAKEEAEAKAAEEAAKAKEEAEAKAAEEAAKAPAKGSGSK